MDQDLQKIWSAFGLQAQAFPVYYTMGPVSFAGADGQPSGERGAIARLSKSLSNFAHMFMGLRISNVYELPRSPTAEDVQLFRALKEHVDGEQTVRITLAQQNITADGVLASQLAGTGIHWHPFPAPFPMAGANDVEVEIRRVSAYPDFSEGQTIRPAVTVGILAAVLRNDPQTAPVRRVGG